MRNVCKIVEDLLPGYVDDLCNIETAEFVSEHLSGCESCSEKYSAMKKPALEEKLEKKELSAVKKPLKKVVFRTVMKTMACVCALAVIAAIVLYVSAMNSLKIFGTNYRNLNFYTTEYVNGKEVRTYIANGEELERQCAAIKMQFVNNFRYKKYLITVESAKGVSVANYGEEYFELFGAKNHIEEICGGTVYISIQDMYSGAEVKFSNLPFMDRKKIERIAPALAYIEEVLTDYAVTEFRDASYTGKTDISGTVKTFEANLDYIQNNIAYLEGDTLKILFSGELAGEDLRCIAVNDLITFDLSGWKDGEMPTYTVEPRRRTIDKWVGDKE